MVVTLFSTHCYYIQVTPQINLMTSDKVIRIQADRLDEAIGLARGEFIPLDYIRKIAEAEPGTTVKLGPHDVPITMAMKGIAIILLKKDVLIN